MIRALLSLMAVGLVGLFAVGIVFSILGPLLALALKVALVMVVGYFLLRLIRPDLAEEYKSKLQGNGAP